MVGAEAEEKV